MNKSIFLFTIVTILIFTSCSDSEMEQHFTVDPNPYDVSEIKIYTRQGEVQNDTLIRFWQDFQGLPDPQNYDLYKDLNGTISGNSVTTRFYERSQKRTITDNGSYEIWENNDVINSEYTRYDMFKYQRLTDNKIPDIDYPNDDYKARRIYKDCFVIEKDETGEYLPITLAIYSSMGNRFFTTDYILHEVNRFDPQFLSVMLPTDTIIVQDYKLKLIKE